MINKIYANPKLTWRAEIKIEKSHLKIFNLKTFGVKFSPASLAIHILDNIDDQVELG